MLFSNLLCLKKINRKRVIAICLIFYSDKLTKYETGEDDSSEEQPTIEVDWDNCEDISIIGAGIGGSYAGYRLRDLGKKITIYEYSDRIGGRCYTGKLTGVPDVNVEYGAMRFYPGSKHIICIYT